MPVNEKSYDNGKIYRIWSLNTDKIYIGSTCDTLSHRFSQHKSSYKRWKDGKGQFNSSFNLFELVGCVENCVIDLEHNFPCESKAKLNKEEGRIQRFYKDIIVNKLVAGRTGQEYKQENKPMISEKAKQYRQLNKTVISEKFKQYRQANKEKINEKTKQYYQSNLEKKKQYYQANKTEIIEKTKQYYQSNLEKKKQYYQANKEKINEKTKQYYQANLENTKQYYIANKEKLNQKFNCECGGKYTYQYKARHEKTIKHENYIKNIS